MIEIFLALVAAFRKGWGYWVLLPLAGSLGTTVGLLLGPEQYRIAFLAGYLGALLVLAGMAVRHRRSRLNN